MSKKILVVEDDENIALVLREALVKGDYEVEVVSDGAEAMNKLNSFSPHLVLTDHEMPGFTGLEMLKELRQRENYVNVVFISARSETDLIVEAFRTGADDYVRKPFRMPELMVRIESSLRHNEVHRDLYKANAKLQELIERDYLTGLYNMRSMYDRIEFELKRAKRFKRNVACVMLDMDHFKSVNDQNDHLFGSFVLQEMGELIRNTMREVDFAARYGGDEFLVVLTETEEKGVEKFCERLREVVEAYEFVSGENRIRLTVSMGYSLNNSGTVDAKSLVRHADHALYLSKEKGRNTFNGVRVD